MRTLTFNERLLVCKRLDARVAAGLSRAAALAEIEAEWHAGRSGADGAPVPIHKRAEGAAVAVTEGEVAKARARAGEWTERGGNAWAKITAGAAALVEKSAGMVTKAASVAAFLATDAGRRLYGEYLVEEARVVNQYRHSRLDPPPPAPAVQKMAATAAWGRIEAAARELVERSGGTLSQAAAVDQYLRTPAGKTAYAEYLAEEERAAQARR
jgi:hypothetical protein